MIVMTKELVVIVLSTALEVLPLERHVLSDCGCDCATMVELVVVEAVRLEGSAW